MKLWQVAGPELKAVDPVVLNKESRLEDWVERDPSILGMDVMIIGRQLVTPCGRIDLLAIDSSGTLIVLELKRDKTPRDVVSQALEYGSWVRSLAFDDVDRIYQAYRGKPLKEEFPSRFGEDLPETINQSHQLIILASSLDESSERIVQYLAEEHDVPINAIFFTVFRSGETEFLGRAWLMDPEEVSDRAVSKKQAPWSGHYFVNVGEGEHRNWDDCRDFGFLAAGHGPKYSRPLRKLKEGDSVFAYMKGRGYVGHGKVARPATMVKDFVTTDGRRLLELNLRQPNLKDLADDPDFGEWAIGVEWKKVFSRDEAKWFKEGFANQNIVCRLRDDATLRFLEREFGLSAAREYQSNGSTNQHG